jgi:K+-sensing histidine kinase KdpD
MRIVKGAAPIIVAFAVMSAVTALLWLVKHEAVGPQHLVFYYLLPTVLMAVLYGTRLAMFCALAGTVCAAFFLYDPLYSFYITKPVEMGELFCFVGLALIGSKCTADLLRPAVNLARQNAIADD